MTAIMDNPDGRIDRQLTLWNKLFVFLGLWNLSAGIVSVMELFPFNRPANDFHRALHFIGAAFYLVVAYSLFRRRDAGRIIILGYAVLSVLLTVFYSPLTTFFMPDMTLAPYTFVTEKFSIFFSLLMPVYSPFFPIICSLLAFVYQGWIIRYFTRRDVRNYFSRQTADTDPAGETPRPDRQAGPPYSKLAVASLVFSLFFALLPVISGLLGVVLGVVALVRLAGRARPAKGRGFAIIGICLGMTQLVVVIAILGWTVFQRQYQHETTLSALHARAVRNLENRRFVQAKENFYEVQKIAERYLASAHYYIGTVLMHQNRYEAAIRRFDQAIAVRPDMYDALQNRAVTFRRMGEYQRSVEACRDILKRFPDSAKTSVSLGLAHMKLSQYRQAAEAYKRAVQLNPRWGFARRQLVQALSKIDDRTFVLSFLSRVDRIDPGLARELEQQLRIWDQHLE